jgi:predicted HTH domain antitoxin
MEPLDIFTVQDLTERSDDLLRDAEQGRLSLITKDGRPAILAVPFDDRLLDLGIHRAMALHLFESGQATLSQSAKVAGLPIVDFLDLLGQAGIPAVDYPPDELERELEAARASK